MIQNKIAFYAPFDKRIKNDGFLKDFVDLIGYKLLARDLNQLGYEVHSLDVFQRQKIIPNICVFLDIPPVHISELINIKTKSIALLRESESISRENFDLKRHPEFNLILTWKENLVDNQKYLSYPSTRIISYVQSKVLSPFDRKLCVLISSNLSSNLPGELYSLRKNIVNWFNINYPIDFDLWGFGWDEYRLILFKRTIFRLKKFSRFIPPLYKGVSLNKLETLSNYKFSICFENTSQVNYYVSEKIFDAFLSQNVPIYYGAPNITEIVPKECYIDFRDFNTFDEMYDFLKNMSPEQYMKYLSSIRNFLNSKKAHKLSMDVWINTLKKSILRLNVN